jgi:hypothetical protein
LIKLFSKSLRVQGGALQPLLPPKAQEKEEK